MLKSALALCLLALIAACSSGPEHARGGTMATFTRSGGIAGFDDTLVVGADGSMVLTDKTGAVRRGTADPADLKRVTELLQGSEFRALLSSYATRGGADRMTYTVSVPRVGKVTTMDGSPHPALLAQIIEEFSSLIGQVK